MIDLSSIIQSLRFEIHKVDNVAASELEKLHSETKKVVQITNQFEDLWVGGWGQENFDEYINPNNNNQYVSCSVNFFYQYINKRLKINVEDIGRRISELITEYKKVQRLLITELSIIKEEDQYVNEIQLLEKIQKFKWGIDQADFVKLRQPTHIPIYNMSVLNRGIQVPPHIAATSYVYTIGTKAVSAKNFVELAIQLIRQVEIKEIKNQAVSTKPKEQVLYNIFDNFHSFCTQLKNRHNGRETVIVNDEYDVQDLLHCILKLHFKDIREEEYTPSYAGSSSRVDFLLKNEEIVIEVKKTRPNLADKHIGDQLILDVFHYRNHPNCKSLICFVYDPESRVQNPRGLETDLKKLSDAEMSVEVYIRP